MRDYASSLVSTLASSDYTVSEASTLASSLGDTSSTRSMIAAPHVTFAKQTPPAATSKAKKSRRRSPISLADRMDRLAINMRERNIKGKAASRLFLQGMFEASFTVIGWILSIVETASAVCEDGDKPFPSERATSVPSSDARIIESDAKIVDLFKSDLGASACPHLRGRFRGLNRELRVLVDPGSEGTFIHKSVIPPGQSLFSMPEHAVVGSVNEAPTLMGEGLVLDLEIEGCVLAGAYQRGTGSGAALCSKMMQIGTEPVSGSRRGQGGFTASMKLWAYAAPDWNGGVDVILGTNVLCRYNAALAMGEHGTLTFDANIGTGMRRVEAPLDWAIYDN